jgi:hypothetical protein
MLLTPALLMLFPWGAARAQQPVSATPSELPSAPEPQAPATQEAAHPASQKPTCLRPAPVIRWEDYEGPLAKVVGALGRRIERKSLGEPEYKRARDFACSPFEASSFSS